jgi:hypothetical protein
VKLSARSITKTALDATASGSSEDTAAAIPINNITPTKEKTNNARIAAKNEVKKLFIKKIDLKEI